MKNINEILKGLGIVIPEDKTKEFEKTFNENYKTVKEVENLNTKFNSLQEKYNEDITSRDKDLETLRKDLKEAGTSKDKLQELTTKFDTLQNDYNTQKSDYEKQLQKQQYEFLVKDAVSTLKFSSNSAKKAFTNELMSKNLNVENGQLMGFNDYVESYKQEDANAFVSEDNTSQKPIPTIVTKTKVEPKPEVQKPDVPLVW